MIMATQEFDPGNAEKLRPSLLPFVALVLSLMGVAGFVFLFLKDFNVYWLILSPVIFVVYQFPAFVVFWLYKKKRDRRNGIDEPDPPEGGQDEAGDSSEEI